MEQQKVIFRARFVLERNTKDVVEGPVTRVTIDKFQFVNRLTELDYNITVQQIESDNWVIVGSFDDRSLYKKAESDDLGRQIEAHFEGLGIREGDYVTHVNKNINGGLQMQVQEIFKTTALCSFFFGSEGKERSDYIPLEDLTILKHVEGGFSDF